MKSLYDIVKDHTFFKDFDEQEIKLITECAKNETFQEGSFLAQEGAPADLFYLIKTGLVNIETRIAKQSSYTMQTISDGELFGWSWLFEPHQWMFDAKALNLTRVITLNGACLRAKLDSNPALGYKLMKRFSKMIIDRLNTTRLQLLDVYGLQDQGK